MGKAVETFGNVGHAEETLVSRHPRCGCSESVWSQVGDGLEQWLSKYGPGPAASA